MQDTTQQLTGKSVLITGAARRIGAEIVRCLHTAGMNILLHYRNSEADAQMLAEALNSTRENSAAPLHAELSDTKACAQLVSQAVAVWGNLDALVNNASSFFATPLGEISQANWEALIGPNLKAPLFLAQAAAPHLKQHHGCIVNIADIHGLRPLKGYPLYSAAEAGLIMLTKALARELGPEVRVNAVAPGAVMWPEQDHEEALKQKIIQRTALKRQGRAQDIASAVLFFIRDAHYITGQVLPVDGGRMLHK